MSNNDSYLEPNKRCATSKERHPYSPSAKFRGMGASEFDDEIDLRDLLDALIRRKVVILACLVVCFAAVALYTSSVTPQYKAKGVLQLTTPVDTLAHFESDKVVAEKAKEFQQAQIKLLQSEQLATKVIEQLNLIGNVDFHNKVLSLSGEAQEEGVVQQAVLDFQRHFEVNLIPASGAAEVSFRSSSPVLAAEVVNTSMEVFVTLPDSDLEEVELSNSLNKQIEVARIKLEQAENELQDFAKKAGIVVPLDPELNLVTRQLAEINDALAKAYAIRASKEARYQQSLLGEPANDFLMAESHLIEHLKNNHAKLFAEYKQLSAVLKPADPKMVQLKVQMESIEESINQEKQAVLHSIKNDYDTAVKTEEYLAKRVEEQKQRAMALEEKMPQYRKYQQEVEHNESIYQSLQRSKEIKEIVEALVADIKIVNAALMPSSPYNKPKIPLYLALGLVLGLMGGVTIALLLEFFDNTIKKPDEMTDRFGISLLGLVPFDKRAANNQKHMALMSYNAPRSSVAEALRTIMTSLRLSVVTSPPKTILFTSILPGEGKTVLSSNACFTCFEKNERCLLIDADLRKPGLHNVFTDGRLGKGLSSVLNGTTEVSEVLTGTDYPKLDFISSGPLPENPAELLSSNRMQQFLQRVSENYDRVILKGPPYQGFGEILALSKMVDGVILIAVEGNTPRAGVTHFTHAVTGVGGRILGTIMNKTGRKSGYGSNSGVTSYSHNYQYGQDLEN